MNELFRTDIMEQAVAAKTTRISISKALREQELRAKFKRVIFSGSGDSYFAGYSLQHAAREYQAREVYTLLSNEAAHYWRFEEHDLVIPISVSGESEKTIQIVRKAQKAAATVLPITGNAESRLAQLADRVLLIPYKSVSRRTPHSTDYMTTLVAISSIIEAISEIPLPFLDEVSELIEPILDGLEGFQDEFSAVEEMQGVNIIGGGPNFGTAQYGAAKFWEAGGSKASAYDVEEVGHGPYMTFRPDELVVLIMPDSNSYPKAKAVLNGIETLGFKTLIITNSDERFPAQNVIRLPKIDELWSPLITCIPLQFLCYTYANYWDIDVSNSNRFDPDKYQAAFSYFRGADYEKLYK